MGKEGINAKLMCRERSSGGHDRATVVVVVVIINFCEFVQAQIAYSYHAIVPESCALDDVRGAAGAKYLTLTNQLLQDTAQAGRCVRTDRIFYNDAFVAMS
jgi:hypothetical protein